jgi:hypothetical protein
MKTQMELGFEGCPKRIVIRRNRVPGARWWFQQMHSLVDQAFDWSTPPARPEQTVLSLGATRPFKRRCA